MVLSSRGNDLFIGQVAGVLEQLQADHQANGLAGSAYACGIQAVKASLTGLLVNLCCQLNQAMLVVDEVEKFLAKQVNLRAACTYL